MKSPAFLSEIAKFASQLASFCRRIPPQIFGNLSWKPPSWLKRSSERWTRLERAYPRLIAPAIIGLLAISCVAAWAWNWYSHLPQPRRVTARVEAIPVTKLEKELQFPHLNIHFSQPAARLEDLHKPSLQGVRIEPQISGKWHWGAEDMLVFQPAEDWPADQKFRITFDKNFFPRQVLMESLVCEARTPRFTIVIRQLELYQDPTNPKQRQVTATLELSHAAAADDLERHLQLQMIAGSQIFLPNDPAPHFTITYGLHRRLAYVRSSPVTLPEREDFLKLALSKGVRTSQGGAESRDSVEQKIRIPSVATMFQIESTNGTIAKNKNGEPEQLLILTTTAEISTRDLAKALDIRLLPKRKPSEVEKADDNSGDEGTDESDNSSGSQEESDSEAEAEPQQSDLKDDERWKSASDVPDNVIEQASPVAFTLLPSEKAQDLQHVFRIAVQRDGELFVRVHKGVRAFGDYPLAQDYDAIVAVPAFPRELQIEGQGGILALTGEKKLSVRSRGLQAIEYEVARVATSQINHLVSQTEGEFQHPSFSDPALFNQENISRIALEHQAIALENKWKANYSAFDFSGYLHKPTDGGSERGLFFLTARAWDSEKKKSLNSIKDSRFVLVTDIGILAKKNSDDSHELFLMSIKEGKPIANATVEVLGKNGIAIQTARTDLDGHCSFASVEKSEREKSPVAFVARNGDDVAFIPYAREDRLLNFSRFEIEGAENIAPEGVEAFVFTERGVYRPGDEIHIGLIVKQRNWRANLKGLPIETEVMDARDLRVQTRKVALTESGFSEFSYQTAIESPTGLYTFNVYLIKNGKRETLLGSTTATVKEFLPDRMKIETRLSQKESRGWIDPANTRASIVLANLYGTPASDRRVTGKIELTPAAFSFSEFRDFTFFDPLLDEKKSRREQSVDLGEKKTDDAGKTEFDLQLERFADATYAMRFIAEGFENESGRSVTGDISTLVSALPYVIGWKADGDLNYIEANKPRGLELIAVDSQLNRIAVENVTLNIIRQEYVSVLKKQENGNYGYESVLKEQVAKSERISLPGNGLHYSIPTTEPGNYLLELRDDQNRTLNKLHFSVVGQGANPRTLEKNAELEVKLDRKDYHAGDEIAVSITAPYAGSGLITIERDKVYAHQWFQTNSAGSVQHIRLPTDFEGSGYINVAFVRALDSKEIFVSPLSYGVVPFMANVDKRRLKIEIDAPVKSKPGEPLRISYKTDRPGKIVIFAVDQGILQVTDYKTPDPLGYFFRKCALGVKTAQIVDLIIPEFSLLRSVSAFGGGEEVQRLNPFKRVTEKPVVFWSGILDADSAARQVTYDVPDFFDGSLRIMAVAVSNETTGSAERDALIRGPFVITPSVPVLAAPGDEFEAGVTIANSTEGSGENAEIDLHEETSAHLSTVGPSSQKMRIAEGHEASTAFRFRVNDQLGSGEIKFVVNGNGTEMQRRATLSVRPPAPFVTDVRSGNFKNSNIQIPITRTMYSESAKREASIAAVPLGLAHGLDAFLKNFPYGCSEQVTSGAFCRLLLADEADFGLNRAEITRQLEHTFEVLRRRQNDQGGFGYWAPENGDHISFVSVYVMDFLSAAKAAGFSPPAEMFSTGLRNLQKIAAREPSNFFEARTVAYAIYLLTREGVVTTNYILNLRDYLDKNHPNDWQGDLTGVYLAGSLKLLHKDSDAERLIEKYRIDSRTGQFCDDFNQPLGANSQYIAVLARDFPDRLRKISAADFEKILGEISDGQFNTLSAAYSVSALKSYSHTIAQNPPDQSITEFGNGGGTRLTSGVKLLQQHEFSSNATGLRFQSSRVNGPAAFYQVIEAGFDRKLPNEALVNGLEVYRELLDKDDRPVTQTKLGEPIHVRLHVRAAGTEPVTNVALVDLLPGGFEIVGSSVRAGVSSIAGVDYVDLREDRAVFFATVTNRVLEINYQIKSTNRGEFVVPPIFAASMYDRNIKGRGVGGKISVTE